METTFSERSAPTVPWSDAGTVGAQLMTAIDAVDGDHPAIIDEHGERSYRMFADELRQLAARIQAAIGVGGGERARSVVTYFPHGGLSIVAQCAVIVSGHILVPLDADQGNVLRSDVVAQVDPPLVLTCRAMLPLPDELGAGGCTILLADDADTAPTDAMLLAGEPDQDVAIYFTSGSTGRARGVRAGHRQTAYVNRYNAEQRGHSTGTRSLHALSDVTTFSLWCAIGPLCSGATVVCCSARQHSPAEIYDAMVRQRVTFYTGLLPLIRVLAQVAEQRGPVPSLCLLFSAGEAPSTADVVSLLRLLPETGKLVLNIGATETTVFVLQTILPGDFRAEEWQNRGLPRGDVTIFITDEQGRVLPTGEMGEILVASPSLAVGYLGDEAATAARFVAAPDGSGRRAFRTGDLGRLGTDGRLEHLGRLDDMVKVRGHRIELGAVNRALAQVSLLREGIAEARTIAGQRALVAYIVWRKDVEPSLTQLRAELARLLPEFAQPTRYVVLDALPRGLSGKVDRPALPPPSALRPALETAYVAPTSVLEQQLVQIWREVLTLGDVGIDDEFFALGGDSLALFRLLTRVEHELAAVIELKQLTLVTVRELAQLVEARTAETGIDTARVRPSPWQPRRSPTRDVGPLFGNWPLPYGIGQRLLRWLVSQPLLRRRWLARHVRQWQQVTAAAGLPFEATLQAHLSTALWWIWRRRALQQPRTAARWITVHGLERLQQRPAGQGVVLVTTHAEVTSSLADLLRRELDRGMISINANGERYGDSRDAEKALGRTRLLVRSRRHLERGGVVLMLGDGRQGIGGVSRQLLGRTVLLRSGAAELALATGAWLVPVFSVMAADGRIVAECGAALRSTAGTVEEQAVDLTEQFADLLVERFAALLPGYSRSFIQTLLQEQ